MSRRIEVFATGTDSVQLIWRGGSSRPSLLELGPGSVELDPTVSLGAVTVGGLTPSTTYTIRLDGSRAGRARTLDRPEGRLLAKIATLSDLHIGETATGALPRLRSVRSRADWRRAHPVWCLAAAIDEIAAWSPDLLVAKGDIAHHNLPAEYAVANAELQRLGVPVLAIGGNHDGGNLRHSDFTSEMAAPGIRAGGPVQVDEFAGGARVITGDTRVEGHHDGSISPAGAAEICAAAANAGGPVLVLLHHQLMSTRIPLYYPHGVPHGEAEAFLNALAQVAPNAWISSGHTHRNRARRRGGLTITEVGSPKDFPGVWAGYELYERGIVQVVRRTEQPRALAWVELTRTTAGGSWGRWAPGSLADRCLVSRW